MLTDAVGCGACTVSVMSGRTRGMIRRYASMSASTSYWKPSKRLAPSSASLRSLSANTSKSRRSQTRMPLRVACALRGSCQPVPAGFSRTL